MHVESNANPCRAKGSHWLRWLGTLALAGSLSSSGALAQSTQPSEASLVPALDWQPCPAASAVQCATAVVPLDYDDPSGAKVNLALARRPADDPARRIGSLFVNLGGPGVGAKQLPIIMVSDPNAYFGAEVLSHFDIIGFDPRFVGESDSAGCLTSDEETELFRGVPLAPRTPEQQARVAGAYQELARRCAERAPQLRYAGSGNVARDLDLLRQAVGDEQLTFVGYSYGTVIAQTYAALYPDRVRALVLDGVLDAEAMGRSDAEPVRIRTRSARAAAATFAEFLRLCQEAGAVACPFAEGGDPATKFAELADASKLPTSSGEEMDTYSELVNLVASELYIGQAWLGLAFQLQNSYTALFGGSSDKLPPYELIPDLPTAVLTRELEFSYSERALKHAVVCADSRNPRDLAVWASAAAAEEEAAPYFGYRWTYSDIGCAFWPESRGAYLGPFTNLPAAPVLVVNPRFDPATNHANAIEVADRFPNGQLLTVETWGHVATQLQNRCATAAIDRYLVELALPETSSCPSEFTPFSL